MSWRVMMFRAEAVTLQPWGSSSPKLPGWENTKMCRTRVFNVTSKDDMRQYPANTWSVQRGLTLDRIGGVPCFINNYKKKKKDLFQLYFVPSNWARWFLWHLFSSAQEGHADAHRGKIQPPLHILPMQLQFLIPPSSVISTLVFLWVLPDEPSSVVSWPPLTYLTHNEA